ncbi:nuclear transport factor 2 family protein [Streptomyces sp. NPDC097610]|uniref:nuclear transport factor 2 family protein n=1 Tax=Streptomyces sp. NPDC097610 TaxID=3157227 RepID=UPI00331C833E
MTTFAEVQAGVLATIAAHAQAQDDGRVEDMAGCYLPDAVLEIPGIATLKGVEAIREAFSQPGWLPDPDRPQRHVTSNTVVTSWDERRAAATSDVTMIKNDGSSWSIAVVARYHDEFEESAGRWLLRRRRDEYVAFQP